MLDPGLVADAWERARGRWAAHLLLGAPLPCDDPRSIAHIDLATRQVFLNERAVHERGLEGSLEAILAHEVGHHVRYPGSLAVAARLRLLEQPLLPHAGCSLVNLFTDLLINEELGRQGRDRRRVETRRRDMCPGLRDDQALPSQGSPRDTPGLVSSEPAKAGLLLPSSGTHVPATGFNPASPASIASPASTASPASMTPGGDPAADDSLRRPLADVFRAFRGERRWDEDLAFSFVQAVYEELWGLDPGELVGAPDALLEREAPGARADAHLLAQDLFVMGPNLYEQFLYFVSVTRRYLRPGRDQADPFRCGHGEPGADDWAEALTPGRREVEAVERGLREGWLSREQADALVGAGASERRIAALPGQQGGDLSRVSGIMAVYYRRQAERYLVRPPPQRSTGEAAAAATLEDWEAGDPARAIDWLATFRARGERVGAASPLRRSWEADDEGCDVPRWRPRVEVFLDVSGSMPDPRASVSGLHLAAQILAVGAIRNGGEARAHLYSGYHVGSGAWCRSEDAMARFLMQYIGGGTSFPFAVLRESVERCGQEQPVRVVISDDDFAQNQAESRHNDEALRQAIARSARFILLLHEPAPSTVRGLRAAGAEVIAVDDRRRFPEAAAALARALFVGGRGG